MEQNIKNTLEVILITYNRKKCLEHTLAQLFEDKSPIKDLEITILDNASTDGSSELIQEYAAKFPNLKHIRHRKNIGGNGNITRAFETATKPYVWVLCDDDSFHWKAWYEIKDAVLCGNYDILLTRKTDLRWSDNIAKIVRQLSFLPSGIYKTEAVTGSVLINMLGNIHNLFPHLVLVCSILNAGGTIFLPQEEMIDKTTFDKTPSKQLYTKGIDSFTAPLIKNMFWTVGFINSLQFIEDKKLRNYILDNVGQHGFFAFIFAAFRKNYTYYRGNSLNFYLIWSDLDFWHRIQFLAANFLLRIITLPYIVKKPKQ